MPMKLKYTQGSGAEEKRKTLRNAAQWQKALKECRGHIKLQLTKRPREVAEAFAKAYDALAVAVLLVDWEGIVLYANAATKPVLGRTRDQLVNLSCIEVSLTRLTRTRITRTHVRTLASAAELIEVEWRCAGVPRRGAARWTARREEQQQQRQVANGGGGGQEDEEEQVHGPHVHLRARRDDPHHPGRAAQLVTPAR
jgi:PAS domain-containing protein